MLGSSLIGRLVVQRAETRFSDLNDVHITELRKKCQSLEHITGHMKHKDIPVEEAAEVPPPAAAVGMSMEQRIANFKKNLYPRWLIEMGPSYIIYFTGKVADVLQTDSTTLDVRIIFSENYRKLFDEFGGGTPLHWAVRMEDPAMVVDILAAGKVDVNARDEQWEATALHWAVRVGNTDIVKTMLTNHLESGKFDLNVNDRWGYTALDCAVLSGITANIPMIRELLKFKIPLRDEYDEIGKVEEILGADSSTDDQLRFDSQRECLYSKARGCFGGTSLHWAVKMEDIAMVAHILEADKVDVNVKDYCNRTAFLSAVQLRNMDIVKAMVTRHLEVGNFDVNVVDRDLGYTALHWAVVSGERENSDMVRELLKCEGTMRVSEECNRGQTPLQIAHERGFKDIQKELMEHDAVRRYVEGLYRDRQVYVDAANAILVGAALIASVTFASWLQPPLGYISGFVDVQHTTGLRAFWVFNSLSFYFAIATVVCGASSVLPRSPYFIKRTVEKLRKNLLATAVLLACSVFFVIIAFGIAGCIVLTPIVELRLYMIIPTIFGGIVCIISLAYLSKCMWEDSLGSTTIAKRRYEWSQYTRNYARIIFY